MYSGILVCWLPFYNPFNTTVYATATVIKYKIANYCWKFSLPFGLAIENLLICYNGNVYFITE
jgi:hypothetical protein